MNMFETTHTHTHTHTQKKQLYRWIGLAIGLVLGLIIAYFGYQKWGEKKAGTYFQKNIGESKFLAELGKWQTKNPLKAREMMTESWKELGIYEELKSETNSDVINRRVMARIEELTGDEKKEYAKKEMKLYQKHAPSFLESFEKDFPWYLRYSRIIFILITLICSGLGFLVGYLLEPEEEKNIANY